MTLPSAVAASQSPVGGHPGSVLLTKGFLKVGFPNLIFLVGTASHNWLVCLFILCSFSIDCCIVTFELGLVLATAT